MKISIQSSMVLQNETNLYAGLLFKSKYNRKGSARTAEVEEREKWKQRKWGGLRWCECWTLWAEPRRDSIRTRAAHHRRSTVDVSETSKRIERVHKRRISRRGRREA